MDTFAVLTPIIVIGFLAFLTLRLLLKYCRPSSSIGASVDTEAPDFTRVANHLFVSNTPHTYSRIYVDESSNVRSVTITRIGQQGHSIVGYVLDPSALMPIHHHHRPPQSPPTYEDSIKSHSPPKYTPATTNSTPSHSMELPTSEATTARIDGVPRGTPVLLHARSMSDSCLSPSREDQCTEEGRKTAR